MGLKGEDFSYVTIFRMKDRRNIEEIFLNKISTSKETEKSVSSKNEKLNLDLSAEFLEIQQNIETVEEFYYAKRQIRHHVMTLKAMKSAAERRLEVCIIFSQVIHFIL